MGGIAPQVVRVLPASSSRAGAPQAPDAPPRSAISPAYTLSVPHAVGHQVRSALLTSPGPSPTPSGSISLLISRTVSGTRRSFSVAAPSRAPHAHRRGGAHDQGESAQREQLRVVAVPVVAEHDAVGARR